LAELLNSATRLRQAGRLDAADKVILAYLAAAAALIAAFWSRLPEATELLALHAGGVALIIMAQQRPGRATWYLSHWYPLPFVAGCYREMSILIPAIRRTTADAWLADLDYRIWHANPTVWLERVQTPALTEILQLIYTMFVPVVLLVPWLLWRRRRYAEFRFCAFLISLGFLVSYIGYIIVPARGPRFYLEHFQHAPLRGLWLYDSLRALLDRLESAHYDCFPSGHVELTMLAWWSSLLLSKRLFWAYLAYTLCMIFATVYLRYHYTVDLLAGALVAVVLLLVAPAMYRKLSGKEDPVGSD
jgi:membrane-associated phospholipid phosphatase